MRKEQTKVYVLMLSKEFPKEHPKAGEQTGFKEKLELALKAQEQAEECATCGGDCKTCYCPPVSGMMKVHTIRTNLERWSDIMQKVQEGKAVISVRQWKGRPYEKGNVQVELFGLGKDGVYRCRRRDRTCSLLYRRETNADAYSETNSGERRADC